MNYVVGQTVEVHSYGAWRRGTVVKIGRTRITVEYAKNRWGELHSKAFHDYRIRRPQK